MTPRPSRCTDVFVIGGGPAGLAAAIAARRRGLEVTVADRSQPPIDKACGEGIMPDGVAAARALGISLEDGGARPFRGIRFCERTLAVEAPFPEGSGIRNTPHRAPRDDGGAGAPNRRAHHVGRQRCRPGGRRRSRKRSTRARALDRRRRWRQFGGAALGRS